MLIPRPTTAVLIEVPPVVIPYDIPNIRAHRRRVSTPLRVFGQRSYKQEPTESNLIDNGKGG